MLWAHNELTRCIVVTTISVCTAWFKHTYIIYVHSIYTMRKNTWKKVTEIPHHLSCIPCSQQKDNPVTIMIVSFISPGIHILLSMKMNCHLKKEKDFLCWKEWMKTGFRQNQQPQERRGSFLGAMLYLIIFMR